MPSQNLTAKFVENFDTPNTGRAEIWDSKEKGLVFRVTAAGSKSFALQFKSPNEIDSQGRRKTRKLTLGSYPSLQLGAARDRARAAKVSISSGTDPASQKIEAKRLLAAEARRMRIHTVSEAISEFSESHSDKATKWKNYEVPRILKTQLGSSLGVIGIGEVTASDLRKIRDRIYKRAPISSNRFVAACKALFKWVAKEYDLTDPTTELIGRVDESEFRRDRFLSISELKKIWVASDSLTRLSGDCVKALILVPHRVNTVLQMNYSKIDAEGLWRITRDQKKQKVSEQILPLPLEVLNVVNARKQNWEHVFCSGRVGDTPIRSLGKIKAALDQEIDGDIVPWRFHDLRRSFATWAAGHGIDQAVTRRILDHKQGFADPLEAIYNQHLYINEQREALNAYAEAIIG